MTTPYIPLKLVPKMNFTDFLIYMQLNIEWNKDIRDNSHNEFDRRWKQGQIDLLQTMLDEMLGIDYDHLGQIMLLMEEIKEAFGRK